MSALGQPFPGYRDHMSTLLGLRPVDPRVVRRMVGLGAAVGGAAAAAYLGLVTGAVPLDLNVGRRVRPLGPRTVRIQAPRDLVFDVIAQPYLGRQTRAIAEKVQVLERGADLVLAAHRTPIRGRLVATTVETVRFTRPERVDFRLVRGPVPHVVEEFVLTADGDATVLDYRGELGADLWALGAWWADLVAVKWEATVEASLASIAAEAAHRARPRD
jgi:hypothetical protein